MARTPTTASTEKGKELDLEGDAPSSRETTTQPQSDLRDVSMETTEHTTDREPSASQSHMLDHRPTSVEHSEQALSDGHENRSEEPHPETQPPPPPTSGPSQEPPPPSESISSTEHDPESQSEAAKPEIQVAVPSREDAMEVERAQSAGAASTSQQSDQPLPSITAVEARRPMLRPEVTLGSPAPDVMDTD